MSNNSPLGNRFFWLGVGSSCFVLSLDPTGMQDPSSSDEVTFASDRKEMMLPKCQISFIGTESKTT